MGPGREPGAQQVRRGPDGKGKLGRFLLPRLRTAVDRVGDGGNPAVDSAEAERLYREALARAPRDADAHWNLAITLQRQGRLSEAIEHYREAARLDPRLAARMGSR